MYRILDVASMPLSLIKIESSDIVKAEFAASERPLDKEILQFRLDVVSRAHDEFGGRDPEAGFVSVAGCMLEEAEEIVDFMPCPFRGTGTRRRILGVDGYAFDEADGSLRVVIADFGGEEQPHSVTRTSAQTEFNRLTAFLEETLSGNDDHLPADEDPVVDFANLLEVHRNAIPRLRLYLVTDGVLSDRLRDLPEAEVAGIPAEFHIWDITRFATALSSRGGREALTVDFSEVSEGGIPCLHASLNQSQYNGYLCVIPGEALARIYDTYGSRLLEGNVRSFLGKTTKVNKGIRETILRTPEMFFAFNNGIAATASSVVVENTPDGMRLRSATDFQIVNGGQTTASLTFSKRKDGADLSGIFVQMKLSVVGDALSGDLIQKIAEFANKQTKVSDSDLFSNHEFHRRMEELSRRIMAPPKLGAQRPTSWFYERAKGQYRIETSKMSPAERQRFESENPKAQLITKTDLAKVENSWRCLPHEVSKGAQKNFDVFSKFIVTEWSIRPLEFNDDYFRNVVVHTIVFRELERLIPAQKDWYDGGYRANVVTFTIAKLVRMIADDAPGKSLDAPKIWKQQGISVAFREQLKLIARNMYQVITSPEEGIENVTEWAKKELAWQRAQSKRIELLPEFEAELILREQVDEIRNAAIEAARIDRGLSDIAAVVAIKPAVWREVRQWGLNNKLLTAKEEQLLLLAATPGKVPTERQAAAIRLIHRKLQQEGLTAAN